ncbi:BrnT family toxin [Candidatus Acetothermia bacterium]|nr:BrnT family toxin [Candidatus Acetothermia bacterium]
MHITVLVWDERNVAHIARHGVRAAEAAEAEEVCRRESKVVLRASKERYIVLGITQAGRYLAVILTFPIRGRARVVTARDMTAKERHYYRRLRRN